MTSTSNMKHLCNDDRYSRVGDCLCVVSLRERNSAFDIYIYPEPLVASFRFISRFHKANFTLEFPSDIQISPPAKSLFDLRRNLTHHQADTFESVGIRRPYVDHCDESRRCKPEFYSRRGILGESVDTYGET